MYTILDASVAVKWLLPEEGSEAALALLYREDGPAFAAPDVIHAEVANAVWKRVKAGELSVKEAQKRIEGLLLVSIELLPTAELIARALNMAAAIAHDAIYDCFYLAAAEKYDSPLVTADRKFLAKVFATEWGKFVEPLA